MVEKLDNSLLDFGGASTHTQCFLHTTNLVAKALIKVFNAKPKKRGEVREGEEVNESDDDSDKSADEARLLKELEELSEGVECEDWDEEDEGKVDNIDGFVDEIEELSDSKHQELLKSIRPIRLALVKVRNGLLVCTLSSADFENTNRSASSHSSSSTPPRSCCPCGTKSLRQWGRKLRTCCMMCQPNGIRRWICWNTH